MQIPNDGDPYVPESDKENRILFEILSHYKGKKLSIIGTSNEANYTTEMELMADGECIVRAYNN